MGDGVGTQAFTLREEGSRRVLSTGCCVLNYTGISVAARKKAGVGGPRKEGNQ